MCNENILVKKYCGWCYCDECKKTEQYKNLMKERNEKREKILLEKYGVRNNFLVKDKNGNLKREQTCLKKYGVKNVFESKEIIEKIENTNLEKYDVTNLFRDESFQKENLEKVKKTNLERYGVEYALQNEDIQKKARETYFKKHGVEFPFQNPQIKLLTKQKWYFTKHHQKLKTEIQKVFTDNNFLSEKFITIEKRRFSIDEIDFEKRLSFLLTEIIGMLIQKNIN